MPSFGDSIFLFVLALLLFGPKKLPVLARELGKWVGEFRRASNEFKMQMEEELRQVEQADRQKQIAAMEAAAPVAPAIEAPEHPHLSTAGDDPAYLNDTGEPDDIPGFEHAPPDNQSTDLIPADASLSAPLPIANSGTLSIMPPSTGLPTPRHNASPLGGLLDAIPQSDSQSDSQPEPQSDLPLGETTTSDPEASPVAVAAETEAHVR
jgi:sec-independent protein translocase protein TatB